MEAHAITLTTSAEQRVTSIIQSYRSIEVLHPLVDELCKSPGQKATLLNIIKLELGLIRGRSQDLAAGEINVYQKAFSVLMANVDDYAAGIELYLDELLGLKSGTKPQQLADAIDLKDLFLDASRQTHPLDLPPTPTKTSPIQPEVPALKWEIPEESSLASLASTHPCSTVQGTDTKLDRLWSLYLEAKSEYINTTRLTKASLTAAKFLRDTIENCITYITSLNSPLDLNRVDYDRSKMNDLQTKMNELTSVLEHAVIAAEKGSGGKKRTFDETNEDRARLRELRSAKSSPSLKHPANMGQFSSAPKLSSKGGFGPYGDPDFPRPLGYRRRDQGSTLYQRRRSASPGRLQVYPAPSVREPALAPRYRHEENFHGHGLGFRRPSSDKYRPSY